MSQIDQLPPEQRDKALGDVFCIRCQKPFRAEQYEEREFRGNLMIEAKCPTCGETAVKPVSTK